MIAPSLDVECCDDLTRLHRIAVFHQKCAKATRRPGGQFGKLLHDLDQANHRIGADLRALLDEIRRLRSGFAIEGPGQWGNYSVFSHVCSSWNSCRKAGKNEKVFKPWRLGAGCFVKAQRGERTLIPAPSSALRVVSTNASAPGVSLCKQMESNSIARSCPSTVRTTPSW